MIEHSHRIHVWIIYLKKWLHSRGNVGKYSRPMDPMGHPSPSPPPLFAVLIQSLGPKAGSSCIWVLTQKIGVPNPQKMDGLFIMEIPMFLMDDLGGFHPLFSDFHPYSWSYTIIYILDNQHKGGQWHHVLPYSTGSNLHCLHAAWICRRSIHDHL